MSKVYLLVVSRIDDHHPIHGPTVEVKNRAFVSAETRATATRHMIDRLINGFDIDSVPEFLREDVRALIDDMVGARLLQDLSYELSCCQEAFGLDVEFQDVDIELEELIGEIVE